jgi:hypothetical protein
LHYSGFGSWLVNPNQSLAHPWHNSSKAPWPVLRMLYQFSVHGIPVHVVQFLFQFFLAPHVLDEYTASQTISIRATLYAFGLSLRKFSSGRRNTLKSSN